MSLMSRNFPRTSGDSKKDTFLTVVQLIIPRAWSPGREIEHLSPHFPTKSGTDPVGTRELHVPAFHPVLEVKYLLLAIGRYM